MITSINLTGVKVQLDDKLRAYVEKRIGTLDRYLPKKYRESVRAEVRLKRVDRKNNNKYEAEVLLHTPDHQIMAKDSTLNMFAALDIVQAKLRMQLAKYKTDHVGHGGKRHIQRSAL